MKFASHDCLQLNRFYKQNKDKARAKPSDLMYGAVDDDGQTCSVLRLLAYDEFLFLRSVLTAEEFRGHGVASTLIRYAINQQIQPIYTLPTPLALSLYQRLGFTPVNLADIPNELLASYRRFRQSTNGPTVMVIHPKVG